MIPRGQPDISFTDLFKAIYWSAVHMVRPGKIKAGPRQSDQLFCLSVRTGFHLALSAYNFSPGSELLVTDISIPDMFRIIETHNLVSVPLAVNKHTLGIRAADLEQAITPSTKGIVVTHLFGGMMDMEEIVRIAKKHNLIIFEDCAQAYIGSSYQGHALSDVVMFSFGLIKTNTTITGAMLKINSADLSDRISTLNDQLPRQTSGHYLKKVFKALFISLLTIKPLYTLFYKLSRLSGKDFDLILSGFTRGFPGSDVLKKIQFRPCAPNMKFIAYRLSSFKDSTVTARKQLAASILRHIPDEYEVGHLNRNFTYWVLPIEIPEPEKLITCLRKHGFDATQKASSLVRLKDSTHNSKQTLLPEKLVYLPMFKSMGATKALELSTLVKRFLSEA